LIQKAFAVIVEKIGFGLSTRFNIAKRAHTRRHQTSLGASSDVT
jgi:hypothetical protein